MQEYIVEVYNLQFEKVADIGPFQYARASRVCNAYKKKGLLATITEKELMGVGADENEFPIPL